MTAEHARATGPPDGSAWAADADAWRPVGNPYQLSYALLLARARLAAGDRDNAPGTLREAHAIAERLGAAPIAADAAALARRARISLTAGPAPEREDELARLGLTGREREILLLVAAGHTNREIAQALFISPKTAGVHVSNCTNIPDAGISGVPGSHHPQYIDVVHREHAVVETAGVRTAKAMGQRDRPIEVLAGQPRLGHRREHRRRHRLLGHCDDEELRKTAPDTLRYGRKGDQPRRGRSRCAPGHHHATATASQTDTTPETGQQHNQ